MTATNVRAYPPGGHGAAKDAAPARAPLTIDLDVDVCVIGAGVAGLTVAGEIARRGWSVAVLEGERIPWSTLDRSAGIVAPGYAEAIERIIDRVGLQHAKELWGLAFSSMDHVRRTAGEAVPALRPVNGHLAVARSANERRLRDRASLLRDEFGADVEFWSAGQVRSALQSARYAQALHFRDAFHLNPLAFVHGLAAAAEQAGARIFEDTPALHIDAEGVRKRVDTASARVRAGQIVLAGGKQLGSLVPQLADAVLSLQTHAAVTVPLGEGLRAAMPFEGSVAELDGDGMFFSVNGERLLWSGRTTTRMIAADRMAPRLRDDVSRTLPQLGRVEFAQVWSSRADHAVHRMPQIGELRSGLWLANAFGRHSLNTAAMAGLLIAGGIADGDDRWRLFSAYGLSWNGGWAGRALAEAVLRARRVRHAINEFLAPYRPAPKAEPESPAPEPLVQETLAPEPVAPELPAHTEAPPIVPPDEAPVTPPAPEPEPAPVLEPATLRAEPAAPAPESAAPAPEALAPEPTTVKPQRVRKTAAKSKSPAKRKPKAARPAPADTPAPADVIAVRKRSKRRAKPKTAKPVAAETPASPAIVTDAPDGGSS